MTRLPQLAGLAVAAAALGALAGCGSTSTATDPVLSTDSPTVPAPTTPYPTPVPKSITLDAPLDGATVSGSFTASGQANSVEANVPWQVLDASGSKVLDGYATASGWMDKLYPYSTSVDVSSLTPGTYTFVVSTDDEADPGEGDGPESISRSITVQ